MVQLDAETLKELVELLKPFMEDQEDRRTLLVMALGNEAPVLKRIKWAANVETFTVDIVRKLADYGEVSPGRQALWVLLEYVRSEVGTDRKARIDKLRPLFTPISFDRLKVPIPDCPIDHWLAKDSIADVRENIIGENTLRHINVLELGINAAKAVVYLEGPAKGGKFKVGTGFMIASDLLMTNNHVIHNVAEAETTKYIFNYQLDCEGKLCETLPAHALPKGLFYTNPDLDYTVVQLNDLPAFGKPLILRRVQVDKDDRVAIIQHPGGEPKQISMQNNFVAYADARKVQYVTSTKGGSSGSPVFNNDFEVVAIHHSGGELRNEGSSMVAVLDDLKTKAPKIYARLNS